MATDDRAELLRQRLVDELIETGYLHSAEWEAVLRRVPRHVFVPSFYVESETSSESTLVDRGTEPDRWLELVYSNQVLATVVGNGTYPDSTSSKPGVMAAFLEALEVERGNSVLEIGTGTGYNAALLCERLGWDRVTTIEVNPELVEQARSRLAECGYHPAVAVADGLYGYSDRAPYDRIIATCSVQRIPLPWTRQLRPDGVIVTPLRGGRFEAGLVSLRRHADGSLQGRLQRVPASFIPLAGQPSSFGSPALAEMEGLVASAAGGTTRPCETRPAWFEDRSIAWRFFLRARIPDLTWLWLPGPSHPRETPAVVGWQDGSWARVTAGQGQGSSVTQDGPRRMWDLLEGSWQIFQELGQPKLDRYGISVTVDGRQALWLDSPGSEHRWEL